MKKLNILLQKYHFVFFFSLLILSMLPILILNEYAYITIHDNLDSELPYRAILAESGKMFAYDSDIDQIMNGLPRGTLASGLNFVMIFYLLFPPLTAYLVNYVLVHVIAFIGMYFLLRDYILKEHDNFIVSGVSFCFAFLPFYTMFGLTSAGLPLLLYSFLNIREDTRKVFSFIVIALFPLYSSLVFIGVFIIFSLGVWLLIDIIRRRTIKRFLIAIIVLGAVYILTEFNMIVTIFQPGDFVSHRSVWNYRLGLSFKESLILAISNFLSDSGHVASFQLFIILFFVPVSILLSIISRQDMKKMLLFLSICVVLSLTYGFENWNGLLAIKEKINLLKQLNIRFFWLSTMFWYMIFALVLESIYKIKGGKYLHIMAIPVLLILCQQIKYIGNGSIEFNSSISLIKANQRYDNDHIITYKEFYSTALFDEINQYIGLPQESYRTLSIGLYPSISQYNGYYTLDSYQSNYSLDYKNKFRNIMEKELDKNEEWKAYFDNWGSRCYIFPAELDSVEITKTQSTPIQNLELNPSAIRDIASGMDVYIFSTVEIMNYSDNEFDSLGYFENEYSPWGIYLYELKY